MFDPDLDRIKSDLATLDQMLKNLEIDLTAKKELAVSLGASLDLRIECVRILRSSTIPIVILSEYRDVVQEIKDLKTKLRQVRNETKVTAERLINTKVERQRIAKLFKTTETSKESCGKLLKFEPKKV